MIKKARRPLSDFKDAHGDWLEYSLWPHADYLTTCHQSGCSVKDISFRTTIYENVDGALSCQCARCGQPITDIVLIVG